MRNCDECSLEILLYLDNVLTGRKLEDLRAHFGSLLRLQGAPGGRTSTIVALA
jgi:hypothetical protein